MLINEKVKKLVEKFEILEKLENIEELEKIEISKNMKSSMKIYTIMLKRMKIRKKNWQLTSDEAVRYGSAEINQAKLATKLRH